MVHALQRVRVGMILSSILQKLLIKVVRLERKSGMYRGEVFTMKPMWLAMSLDISVNVTTLIV